MVTPAIKAIRPTRKIARPTIPKRNVFKNGHHQRIIPQTPKNIIKSPKMVKAILLNIIFHLLLPISRFYKVDPSFLTLILTEFLKIKKDRKKEFLSQMPSTGIEPIPQPPEGCVLSVELRGHTWNRAFRLSSGSPRKEAKASTPNQE